MRAELASISPLLFRVLGVFEAWTLQAQVRSVLACMSCRMVQQHILWR
jgi:hypothetical protein